ncbi:MAG: hypothetical protein KAS32_26490 [Candidatus Peribacteraceae bacterium]|nr:hypothetical protein [Candidatus Peribacteraceae bacterium]
MPRFELIHKALKNADSGSDSLGMLDLEHFGTRTAYIRSDILEEIIVKANENGDK